MKNLPDKIYLNFGEMTKEEFEADDYNKFCKLDEFSVTFCEDKVYDTDVEYVRKDAFIENACEFWKDHLAGYDICEDDIERSIESFKLVMEL